LRIGEGEYEDPKNQEKRSINVMGLSWIRSEFHASPSSQFKLNFDS
jgi:hypothetical protein